MLATIAGTALLTLFYASILDLAKTFLDPFDNEDYGRIRGGTRIEVDTLVQETNRGSRRWLAAVELPPEDFQGGAEERARAAEAPEEGADAAGGLLFEPDTVDVAAAASLPHRPPPPPPPTHAEADVDVVAAVAPPHRPPSPPQAAADRGRGDAEDSGMVGERALAQAEAARIEHLARRIKSEVVAR